ncbi:BadF/BadG/BcrA/BcrD ATPase family protein [Microbulbifer sp. YPW16]|uniref:BadF/BadG/BcrA/BcrD ATPase family protein n=1 Tax=Microbulbifer sp. YPW16 TaxID=2904242 RepID=UPI001E40F6E7|nr:BadF/BadG/BcrA/BcrD ATPase family protein [Microbulbifer sp. YPW16]UHQ56019.1 ATPase [Microbulbifer sp. YPW16]
MSDWSIGIDGGGTKTLARLQGNGETLELRGGPASLTQDQSGAIGNITTLCRQLLAQRQLAPEQVALACGVAGAGNSAAAESLQGHLESMGFRSVRVCSDAITSLFGAAGGTPVVVAAVGTGSVVMRLNRDGTSRQFGGWGLAVGDEGSGAAIGKGAVRALLWELDLHGRAESDFCRTIMQRVGGDRASILPWLQTAGSYEYAALAPAVFEHLPTCARARAIVTERVAEVERLVRAALGDDDLPLTLLGGLADRLAPHFPADLRARLVPPRGSALDGACALARQEVREHA